MIPPPEHRARHHRGTDRKHAAAAGMAALALTGAAPVTGSTQYRRTAVFDTVEVTAPGARLVGINTDHGDTAALRAITIVGGGSRKVVPCRKYLGNDTGAEPTANGSGPEATPCDCTASDITYR